MCAYVKSRTSEYSLATRIPVEVVETCVLGSSNPPACRPVLKALIVLLALLLPPLLVLNKPCCPGKIIPLPPSLSVPEKSPFEPFVLMPLPQFAWFPWRRLRAALRVRIVERASFCIIYIRRTSWIFT